MVPPVTPDDFRRLALAVPGAVEASHMDHPDFRVGGRIFATLGVPDVAWGMLQLTPEQQRDFIAEAPGVFEPCNGAWGERGATRVHLPTARPAWVKAGLLLAQANVLAAAAARKRKPRKR